MPQVTNQQLQQMMQALTDRQNATDSRLDRIESRMKTHEDQEKENYIILRRVEDTVNGYNKVINSLATLLRYLLGVIALGAGSVLAYWVMGLLHIHP